eukprot:368867_1
MNFQFIFLLIECFLFDSYICNYYCNEDDLSCSTDSNIIDKTHLNRLDTTAISQIQEITLQSQTYKLKKLSQQPLVFEISNYLTNIECNAIISTAKKKGMISSYTEPNQQMNSYQIYDNDHNGNLNLSEMRVTIEQNHDVNLNDNDIIEMYDYLQIDKNKDRKLSMNELNAFNPQIFTHYIQNILLKNKPWKHSRYSQITWLFHPNDYNDIITNIHHRLYDLFKVFKLPQYIVNDSYPLQVVQYNEKGLYNAHYDSTFKSDGNGLECCFIVAKHKYVPCKSCRFMTILYYLNDVENGGATAFPLSNEYFINKRFNEKSAKFDLLKWRMNEQNLPETYCNENNDILKVKAVKGKALIWFNHLLDKNQWKGDCDIYGIHTGCPIIKGQKWIANHWIVVDARH